VVRWDTYSVTVTSKVDPFSRIFRGQTVIKDRLRVCQRKRDRV